MSTSKVFLRPEHGHPSSLWPSADLVVEETDKPFYMPVDLGISSKLGREILKWTEEFQVGFVDYVDGFDGRPVWASGFDRYRWYETGWDIIHRLRKELPHAMVVPQFSQYAFSVNERRENFGKQPLCLPGENLPGHIDIRELNRTHRER